MALAFHRSLYLLLFLLLLSTQLLIIAHVMLQGVETAATAKAAAVASACAHARPDGFPRHAAGGLSAAYLQRCYREQQKWQTFESGLVRNMRACAWCGRVAFGGQHSLLWQHMRIWCLVLKCSLLCD